jgi:hydrogenase expression/formation protein HypC
MCIGIPMQVIEVTEGYAVCEGMGTRREVNTQLVGEQAIGTWLLIFLESAREVLSPEDAVKISDAVKAVNLVMQGKAVDPKDIDALFPDLVDREPQLPEHMIAANKN